MVVQCNATLDQLPVAEEALWPEWSPLTFHQLGLGVSSIFGLVSLLIAFYLIFQHATHYLVPDQQKHIIRILLMIPVYSTVSFLSYLYYRHAVYFQVARDCYEAFAISSFFTLMCEYVAPGLHEQKKFFRTLTPVNWFWGVFFMQKCTGGEDRGPFRKPRSGLTWFNVIWAGVFQYCLIRVLFTIVSVISERFDRYCEHSLNPAFAHIWVVSFEGASVTVAMFCLVQFYIQLKQHLSEHRPALKIICIKLVIFFSFWQTMVISLAASSHGPLQPTKKLSYPDIYIGIPSVLLVIEMAFFAVLHIFAFHWKPYSLKHGAAAYTRSGESVENGAPTTLPISARRYRGFWYAMYDSFNPWDIVKASARGLRWMFVRYKVRHADPSYKPAPAASVYKLSSTKEDDEQQQHGSAAAAGATTTAAGTDVFLQQPGATSTNATASPINNPLLEDDTAGLLSHSSQPGRSASPPESSPHRGAYNYHDNGFDFAADSDLGAGNAGQSARRKQTPHPNAAVGFDNAFPPHPPAWPTIDADRIEDDDLSPRGRTARPDQLEPGELVADLQQQPPHAQLQPHHHQQQQHQQPHQWPRDPPGGEIGWNANDNHYIDETHASANPTRRMSYDGQQGNEHDANTAPPAKSGGGWI
ncbi:hypothetical protein Q7P37_007979 [Cladosporium fusiforme]